MASSSNKDPQLVQWHFTDFYKDFHFHIQNKGFFLLLLLFFLLLLITTFSLYTHWVCQGRSNDLDRLDTNSNAVEIASHNMAISRPGSGLDQATINMLPMMLVSALSNHVDDKYHAFIEHGCSICLSQFDGEERVKVLPRCNHVFHSECVDRWLGKQSNCPLCREPLFHVDSVCEP